MTVFIISSIYALVSLNTYRYLGYWARHGHSVCLCGYGDKYDSKTNPCPGSGFFDYGWTFLASSLWPIIILGRVIYRLSVQGFFDRNIGFFKEPGKVETQQEKIKRLEKEARERQKYIAELEHENLSDINYNSMIG